MASKSKKTRKGIAVGLAVLGVAGLSLASASQLNLTGVDAVQTGAVTVSAACQTSTIAVSFAAPTQTSGAYASSKVTFTKIDQACAGKKYKVAFTTVLSGTTAYTETTEATLPATIAAGGVAYDVTLPTLPTGAKADDVTKIALTIY